MHSNQVSKSKFKAHALEYFRHVEATGEAIIVTESGRLTLEVRRHKSDQRPPLERLRASVVELTEPFEPLGEDDWEVLR